MRKNKDWTIGILVGVILALVIILGVYLSLNKTSSTSEELSDNDFKIISASWDNKYDWNFLCGRDVLEKVSAGYNVFTQQNYNLTCSFFINGEEKIDTHTFINEYGQEEQIRTLTLFEQSKRNYEGMYNLNYTRNNEIIICCSSFDPNIKGEVCDSITLPAKCSA